MAAQASQQPRPYNNGYLPNGATPSGPVPGAAPLLPNQGRVIETGRVRILCVADVRGNLRSLNELARSANADYIIHTGDFGFYDNSSLERIAEKTLKHVVLYSPLVSEDVRHRITVAQPNPNIKQAMQNEQVPLSQLPLFLNGTFKFDVPVYTVWGACEDVQVIEKLRIGEYKIENLHIIDEAHSRLLEVGGVKLRLLGLGGAVVMHKLFDNGEGRTTIAGGQGTMWTTFLQIGELVDTANRVFDPTEVRVLVTHASPAREGILNQLSVTLKADFTISAGLHFRYGSSYNEYSVNPSLEHYRGKLAASKASFQDVWETVRSAVEPAVAENESQTRLLHNALAIINNMPSEANGSNPFGGATGGPSDGQIDETAFKNMWNFNLADAAFGWLVFQAEDGKVKSEMHSAGFNFTRRGNAAKLPPQTQVHQAQSATVPPTTGSAPIASPAPAQPTTVQARPSNPPTGYQGNRQAQPIRTQSNQQAPQAKSPANPPQSTPSRSVASPGAAAAAPKSASPAPQRSAADASANGAAAEEVKPTSPSVEKKPSTGIHMMSVTTEDEARNILAEEDRSKITKLIVKSRAVNVFFASNEEMLAVLGRIASEYKGKSAPGKPHVRIYEDMARGSFGPGAWQGSSRGGSQQAGGYKSGGASDSEGGRGGRGAFRGGRGRGTERGRGGRGGRGTPSKGTEGASSPAPAASSPAAAPPATSGS